VLVPLRCHRLATQRGALDLHLPSVSQRAVGATAEFREHASQALKLRDGERLHLGREYEHQVVVRSRGDEPFADDAPVCSFCQGEDGRRGLVPYQRASFDGVQRLRRGVYLHRDPGLRGDPGAVTFGRGRRQSDRCGA
jgi:hypothetical protein